MFNHTLELKIWDTKDKVSAKARFDRPKTFRLPTSRGGDERDIEKIKKLLLKNGLTQKEASRVSTAITPGTLFIILTLLSLNSDINMNKGRLQF